MKKFLLLQFILTWFHVTHVLAQQSDLFTLPSAKDNLEAFNTFVNKIKITPGHWRPMFNSEQICWISPKWGSQEYIYLDFPEAIFIDNKLIFLSHISDRFPAAFNYRLPGVTWLGNDSVLYYNRNLNDQVLFGGEIKILNQDSVGLKIWMKNNTNDTLKNILMQTCAYLHQIKEFDVKSNSNKFIHTKSRGWISLEEALSKRESLPEDGKFKTGWREGRNISDLPVIITSSLNGSHFTAMTWNENTFSFIGNSEHPCFHADPDFPDLLPEETRSIEGYLFFYQGTLHDFESYIESRFMEKR